MIYIFFRQINPSSDWTDLCLQIGIEAATADVEDTFSGDTSLDNLNATQLAVALTNDNTSLDNLTMINAPCSREQNHLISSHLTSSHLISSHLISAQLISLHLNSAAQPGSYSGGYGNGIWRGARMPLRSMGSWGLPAEKKIETWRSDMCISVLFRQLSRAWYLREGYPTISHGFYTYSTSDPLGKWGPRGLVLVWTQCALKRPSSPWLRPMRTRRRSGDLFLPCHKGLGHCSIHCRRRLRAALMSDYVLIGPVNAESFEYKFNNFSADIVDEVH